MSVKIPDPKKTFYRASTYIYSIILAYLLLRPGSTEVPGTNILPGFVLHISAFFILGFLIQKGFRDSLEGGNLRPLTITYISAAILELMQSSIPGRFFSLIDMVSNITGLTAGLLVSYILTKMTERQ